ncbi:MAG: energy transducer TonB, partial [Vicinamibacteria bacterium]
MNLALTEPDRFRQMLVWSLALHVLLLAAGTLAVTFRSDPSVLPTPVAFMDVSLGQSGPLTGAGGGATETPPQPTLEPPPPEPPQEMEPEVVRPTKEVRDEVPLPDAPVRKNAPEPTLDSGLRGADAASAPSAALQGPPGLGLGGTGGGSPFDQDFEYAYYVRQMLAKIHQHWQRTAVRGTAVVIVRFTITRDGRILDPEVETSSGVSILDRSSIRAVMLSDPLPPLPNSYA